MTVPVVAGTTNGSGAAVSSFTLTSWTPAANNLILVFVAMRTQPTTVSVSSITGNGLTFVLVTRKAGTQNQEAIELWRAQGASPSAGQITVNFTATATAAVAVAHRISGANTGGTNGSAAVEVNASADTGAVDTAAPSVDITTISADCLVIGGCSHRNRTFSVGTGETALSLNNAVGTAGDETRCSTEYQNVTSASLVTIDGTLASAIDWSIIAAAIKASGNSIAAAATLSSASSTPDTNVLAIARALSRTLSSASSTPDTNVLAIARALSRTLSSASSTPDTAALARLLQAAATLAGTSSTPDTAALTAAFLIAVSATLSSASSTPDTNVLAIARALSRTLSSTSSTPDTAAMIVARALSRTLSSASSTPDTIAFQPLLLAYAINTYKVLQQLRTFVATIDRLFTVEAPARTFEAKTMSLTEIVKDPDASVDYEIDWATYLPTGDTISSSTWSADVGLTVVASSSTSTSTTVRLSGGTLNSTYDVKNTVTLQSGQIDVRRLTIVITQL